MIDSRPPIFRPGTVITRREVLQGRPWMESPVTVVADDGDHLAVLLRPGSRFTFYDHPHGTHPWGAYEAWSGPQVLQLHRSGDPYSVWKFFDDDTFRCWYVNFEAPLVRRSGGFDTDDHGLDLVILPNGVREWKDVDHLQAMRRSGRFTDAQALGVLEAAEQVWHLLERDDRWWSAWDSWQPPTDHALG